MTLNPTALAAAADAHRTAKSDALAAAITAYLVIDAPMERAAVIADLMAFELADGHAQATGDVTRAIFAAEAQTALNIAERIRAEGK